MRASVETPAKPVSGLGSGLHLALLIEEGARRMARPPHRQVARSDAARASRSTSLPHCAFDTSLACGIDIPGFDGALPDGVFVRSISAGTLEQITFRLGLLHALRESGVRVWNDARAIERCVDKSTRRRSCCTRPASPTPRTRVMRNAASCT